MVLPCDSGQERQSSFDFFIPSTFGPGCMNFYWASKTCFWGFSDFEPECGSKCLLILAILMALTSFPLKFFWVWEALEGLSTGSSGAH